MDLFRANFGERNCFWPEVKARGALLVFEDMEPFECLEANDERAARAAMIASRKRYKGGDAPRENVISRWVSLHREFHETVDDVWLFWAADGLWWGESSASPVEIERNFAHPSFANRPIARLWKPLKNGWSNTDRNGRPLSRAVLPKSVVDLVHRRNTWARVHREKQFLLDLIDGADVTHHYERLADGSLEAHRAVWTPQPKIPPKDWLATATRMIDYAKAAAARSGTISTVTAKTKAFAYNESTLYEEIARLLDLQEYRCIYTGILLRKVGEEPRDHCASLDRIDSDLGYEPGNLQIVCGFINNMKSSMPDGDFRRRLSWIRQSRPLSGDEEG